MSRFLGLLEEDESSSEEEVSGFEPGKQSTVPQYWTGVRERSQLGDQKVR